MVLDRLILWSIIFLSMYVCKEHPEALPTVLVGMAIVLKLEEIEKSIKKGKE